jgi:hypothetical protein
VSVREALASAVKAGASVSRMVRGGDATIEHPQPHSFVQSSFHYVAHDRGSEDGEGALIFNGEDGGEDLGEAVKSPWGGSLARGLR